MQTGNENEMIDKKEKQFIYNNPCKRNFQRTRRKKTKCTFNIREAKQSAGTVPKISGLLRRRVYRACRREQKYHPHSRGAGSEDRVRG